MVEKNSLCRMGLQNEWSWRKYQDNILQRVTTMVYIYMPSCYTKGTVHVNFKISWLPTSPENYCTLYVYFPAIKTTFNSSEYHLLSTKMSIILCSIIMFVVLLFQNFQYTYIVKYTFWKFTSKIRNQTNRTWQVFLSLGCHSCFAAILLCIYFNLLVFAGTGGEEYIYVYYVK